MNVRRRVILVLLLSVVLAFWACGKKTPPFLNQNAFSVKVMNLKGEWHQGELYLKGDIVSSKDQGGNSPRVNGCKVYYAQYPTNHPPCEGCPIQYQGYEKFGPEVITSDGFRCRVPMKENELIYFFKVHLIGADGAVGPASNTVRVYGK